MKNSQWHAWLIPALLFLLPLPGRTQAPAHPASAPENELLLLSLEQLLDIMVVSSSKRFQKMSEAPATMTVWTDREMNELGYYTLYDLADITPGFSSYYIYGERVLETRGRKAGSFENNKHLILIDGIPVNHARAMKGPIEEDLPLLFAERVEFLTGPASALYGVSAYYGAIEIASREPQDRKSDSRARFSFATPDFHRSVMGSTVYFTDRGTFKMALSYYEKDASKQQLGISDPTYGYTFTPGNKNVLWDDKTALFVYGSYRLDNSFLKGLEVGSINLLRTTGMGEHWMWGQYSPEANELQWGTFIPYVRYRRNLSKTVALNTWLLYNRSHEKSFWAVLNRDLEENFDGTNQTAPYSIYNVPVNNIQGQAEIHWMDNRIMDLIVGLNVDYKHQAGRGMGNYSYSIMTVGPEPIVDTTVQTTDQFFTISPYLQVQKDLPVLKGLGVTIGLRNDNGIAGDNTYSAFSPRVGLVQKFTDWLNLKLLYGAAIRAPGIKEVGLNLETMRNEEGLSLKDIEPEKIHTWEAGLVFPTRLVLSTATYFHNYTTNELNSISTTAPSGNTVNVFQNGSERSHSDGFELSVAGRFDFGLNPFINLSYAKTRLAVPDQDYMEQFADVPSTKLNVGVNYRSPIDLYATVAGKWIKDFRTNRIYDANGGPAGWQPRPDGFFVLDALVGYDVTENLGLQFQIRNLLDSSGNYPKGGRLMASSAEDNRGLQDVPIPPRTFFGTLTLSL